MRARAYVLVAQVKEPRAVYYGRLLEMSRMQPRARAYSLEKTRETEKRGRRETETMEAARHDGIVILSRMAPPAVRSSIARDEKWPCLNVSGTPRHGKRLSYGDAFTRSRATTRFQGCSRGCTSSMLSRRSCFVMRRTVRSPFLLSPFYLLPDSHDTVRGRKRYPRLLRAYVVLS